jgi:tetratricopeptide (TPR) repeat protein
VNAKALLAGAVRAHGAGRLREAQQLYRQVLGIEPGSLDALSNLALVSAQMAEFAPAEEMLSALIRREPRYAGARVNLALVLHQQNKYDQAIQCAEDALKVLSDNKSRQKLQNTLALSLMGAKRHGEALELLQKMTAAHPGFAGGHNLLGTAYTHLGRPDDAVRAFNEAARLDPKDYGSFVAAGECLLVHGRAEEALAQLDRALRLKPWEVRALALRTLALAGLGREDDEKWLSDPARLVHCHHISELGYTAERIEQLNRELSSFASTEPSLREDPPQYATLKAWHSTTNLAHYANPALDELKRFVDYIFQQRRARLAAEPENHPFRRAAPDRYDLDLWAIRMKEGGGKLYPHIHVDGWLSGVYYVDVPSVVNDPQAAGAGWLNVGGTRVDIRLEREPLARRVKPEPGMMVTFPSYFWHDTVPLPEGNTEQRLCLAYDLNPR